MRLASFFESEHLMEAAKKGLAFIPKRYLHHASWILFGRLANQCLSFVFLALIVRYLSQAEYGQYAFILTLTQLAAISSLPGASEAILQSVARGNDGAFHKLTRLAPLTSLVGSGVLLAIAAYQFINGDAALAIAACVTALLFPFFSGMDKWEFYYKGREKFAAAAIARSVLLVLQIVILLVVINLNSVSLTGIVLITFSVMAFVNCALTLDIHLRKLRNKQVEPKSITYAFHTTKYAVPDLLATHCDKMLLFLLISPESLAIYTAADKIPELVKKNIQAFGSILIPSLARKQAYTNQIDFKLNVVAAIYSCLILFATVLVIPWFLPLAFGAKYTESVFYCQLLMISVAIGIISTIKFSYIRAKFDLRGYRSVVLTMSICRIVFAILLVPWLGILGAAISTILYRVVTLGLVQANLQRHRRDPAENS